MAELQVVPPKRLASNWKLPFCSDVGTKIALLESLAHG